MNFIPIFFDLLEIYKHCVMLDLDRNNVLNFAHVFSIFRGPNRSKPYKFNPTLGFFSHR